MVPTVRTLALAAEDGARLFPHWKWEVLATGRDQFPMNTVGVLMGCDIVRVGFEDNIYLPNGNPPKENFQLVEAMAEIAQKFGRKPRRWPTPGKSSTSATLNSAARWPPQAFNRQDKAA